MIAEARLALLLGALLAASGVALGAFGAHGLKAVLDAERLGWWHTAVQYQLWHAIGLVAIGAAALPGTRGVAILLGLGVLLFSGSLYVMALANMRWLGMVTPLGGVAMIAGWLLLAWRVPKG
ncbi:DUF423 domain-containing protein [Sphingosinicella sp. LHD-64]|uniref:DUF423 domain-containing protein n=1 Tax=Sphingosinicella sp. LHD-64 TaxID=3072139 RepID=UPI00280E9B43|nr:DUF423 domain-containing protein [Sphingosinicella sp. LHD-64]MDQ8757812.1 DUF423 domain-containing protein [Sphingosinicella sp. LHD-64]